MLFIWLKSVKISFRSVKSAYFRPIFVVHVKNACVWFFGIWSLQVTDQWIDESRGAYFTGDCSVLRKTFLSRHYYWYTSGQNRYISQYVERVNFTSLHLQDVILVSLVLYWCVFKAMVIWGLEMKTTKSEYFMIVTLQDRCCIIYGESIFFGRSFHRMLRFLSFFDFRDRHSRFMKDLYQNGVCVKKKKIWFSWPVFWTWVYI